MKTKIIAILTLAIVIGISSLFLLSDRLPTPSIASSSGLIPSFIQKPLQGLVRGPASISYQNGPNVSAGVLGGTPPRLTPDQVRGLASKNSRDFITRYSTQTRAQKVGDYEAILLDRIELRKTPLKTKSPIKKELGFYLYEGASRDPKYTAYMVPDTGKLLILTNRVLVSLRDSKTTVNPKNTTPVYFDKTINLLHLDAKSTDIALKVYEDLKKNKNVVRVSNWVIDHEEGLR